MGKRRREANDGMKKLGSYPKGLFILMSSRTGQRIMRRKCRKTNYVVKPTIRQQNSSKEQRKRIFTAFTENEKIQFWVLNSIQKGIEQIC